MASSSSLLLAALALAALFAVGSCSELTFTVGEGSGTLKLKLDASAPVSEVSVKEKGATDWSDDLKESPPKTFTYHSAETIKGPISVRFSVKGGGYRVVDDLIPDGYKAGKVYKTGVQV